MDKIVLVHASLYEINIQRSSDECLLIRVKITKLSKLASTLDKGASLLEEFTNGRI